MGRIEAASPGRTHRGHPSQGASSQQPAGPGPPGKHAPAGQPPAIIVGQSGNIRNPQGVPVMHGGMFHGNGRHEPIVNTAWTPPAPGVAAAGLHPALPPPTGVQPPGGTQTAGQGTIHWQSSKAAAFDWLASAGVTSRPPTMKDVLTTSAATPSHTALVPQNGFARIIGIDTSRDRKQEPSRRTLRVPTLAWAQRSASRGHRAGPKMPSERVINATAPELVNETR